MMLLLTSSHSITIIVFLLFLGFIPNSICFLCETPSSYSTPLYRKRIGKLSTTSAISSTGSAPVFRHSFIPLQSKSENDTGDTDETTVKSLNTTITNLSSKIDKLKKENEASREYINDFYSQNSYYSIASKIANFKNEFKGQQERRITNSKSEILSSFLKIYERVIKLNHELQTIVSKTSQSTNNVDNEVSEIILLRKTFTPLVLQFSLKLSSLGLVPLSSVVHDELRDGKSVKYDEKTMEILSQPPTNDLINENTKNTNTQTIIDEQQLRETNGGANVTEVPIFVKLIPTPSTLPKTTPFNPYGALSFNKEVMKKAWVVTS